jgi:hypothetical protein
VACHTVEVKSSRKPGGLLQADEHHLLRALLAEMHEDVVWSCVRLFSPASKTVPYFSPFDQAAAYRPFEPAVDQTRRRRAASPWQPI